jgi:hypothetical protein
MVLGIPISRVALVSEPIKPSADVRLEILAVARGAGLTPELAQDAA